MERLGAKMVMRLASFGGVRCTLPYVHVPQHRTTDSSADVTHELRKQRLSVFGSNFIDKMGLIGGFAAP